VYGLLVMLQNRTVIEAHMIHEFFEQNVTNRINITTCVPYCVLFSLAIYK